MKSISIFRHPLVARSATLAAAIAVLGASGVVVALRPPETPSLPDASDVKAIGASVILTTAPEELTAALESRGLEVTAETNAGPTASYVEVDAPVTSDQLKAVGRTERDIIVGDIATNRRYGATLIPNDTRFGQQWNLTTVEAPTAWDATTGSAETTIAVVDSGVLSSQQWGNQGPFANPDMPGSKLWNNGSEIGATTQEGPVPNCTSRGLELDRSCNNLDDDGNGFVDDWRGWDFMGGWRGAANVCPNHDDPTTHQDTDFPDYITQDNDPQPYSCDDYTDPNQLNKDHYDDACGYGSGACAISHGTSVASIAASASNNTELIAGVDWNARIMPLRVLDGYGYGGSTQIAAAIDYASANGADVINLSLALSSGGDCTISDSLVEAALGRAEQAGVLVVAASGNEGDPEVCYPARAATVVAVGASDSSDRRAGFSSYGPELDLIAPGVAVPAVNAPSVFEPGLYSPAVYGTSFAAPHVAGAAALMRSSQPDAGLAAIRNGLRSSADRVSAMQGLDFTEQHGYGRLNVERAQAMETTSRFVAMSHPRNMWLERTSQKIDFESSGTTGGVIPRGQIMRFVSKTYFNGQWYLRTAHDTANDIARGFPLDDLAETPRFSQMKQPRSMRLTRDAYKSHLLLDSNVGPFLRQNTLVRFETTVLIGSTRYLRTALDTDRGAYHALPLSILRER